MTEEMLVIFRKVSEMHYSKKPRAEIEQYMAENGLDKVKMMDNTEYHAAPVNPLSSLGNLWDPAVKGIMEACAKVQEMHEAGDDRTTIENYLAMTNVPHIGTKDGTIYRPSGFGLVGTTKWDAKIH